MNIAQKIKTIKSKKLLLETAQDLCVDVWGRQDNLRPWLTIGHVFLFDDGSELFISCKPY